LSIKPLFILGERREVNRKIGLSVFVFLLLSLVGTNFQFIKPVRAATTWTVDDDGPADFHTIQEAIDEAISGDTIFVYNGTYHEHVIINRYNLKVFGQDRDRTVIDGDGTGSVVHVAADRVKVANFTVRDSGDGSTEFTESGVLVTGSNCEIENNIVTRNYHGIMLYYSENDIVRNNLLSQAHVGLYLYGSGGHTVEDNVVTENSFYGVYILQCESNTLSGNNLTYNRYNFHVAGHEQRSAYTQQIDTSNLVDGKPIYYFMNLKEVTINSSTCPNAGCLVVAGSTRVTIKDLILAENNGAGLLLAYTTNSVIENLRVSDSRYGIELRECENIIIDNNEISYNQQDGILLTDTGGTIIKNNVITQQRYRSYAITFIRADSNSLYHNYFDLASTVVVAKFYYDPPNLSINNVWDDGYPPGGNVYSDYTGEDSKNGESQDQEGSDGIGDTPYIIDNDNIDRYPLIRPFACTAEFKHDPEKPAATELITFNASDSSSPNGNITSYEWNFNDGNTTRTTDPIVNHAYNSPGKYAVSLKVRDDAMWNTTAITLTVTFATDFDRDGTVNIVDISIVAIAFGTKEGDENYNVLADLDENSEVNIIDVSIAALDYGKTV